MMHISAAGDTLPANLHPLAIVSQGGFSEGGLRGLCRTTFACMVATLGQPHLEDIDGKVNVEWTFRCADGTTFSVYDWKQSAIPVGPYDWHIGGNSDRALEAFTRHTGLPTTQLTYNRAYDYAYS
jgi:hypothetical protein